MIDCSTKAPLQVLDGGDGGPYIMVPVEQVDDLRSLLEMHHIQFQVDEEAISIDAEPEITVVNLFAGTDPRRVQAILDSTP
jgi:hypothetical protein